MVYLLMFIVCSAPGKCALMELVVDSCAGIGWQQQIVSYLREHPELHLERIVSCTSGRSV